ncbi:MAG: cell division protein FtsZ [Bacteroidales bacterium]
MAEDRLMNFDLPIDGSSIIKVVGIGGGGGNAINHMYNQGIKDVNFVVCNTDAQALSRSPVSVKIQLGESLTEGRGAGNKPEIGRQAAIENLDDVMEALSSNTKMVFLTAGMGGGTGTGSIPIIAKAAKEQGILTVAIVTIPFRFEGQRRINQAIEGIHELGQYVDSLLVINNEKLREVAGNMKLSEAFSHADNILAAAAKGIAEIITVPGYVNVDFADVHTVLADSGVALMGTGMAEGENRATTAIEEALSSPLLNDNDITGTENILLNINSGNEEITMDEIGEITDYINAEVGANPNIIWGTGTDETLENCVSVTIIATGYEDSSIPELYTKKSYKKKVTLEEGNKAGENVEYTQYSSNGNEQPDAPPNNRQRTFDFDIHNEQKKDTFIVKHKKNKDADGDEQTPISKDEMLEKLRENRENASKESKNVLRDLKNVEALENEPAYKRKKIKIDHPRYSKDSKVSRYTLSDDDTDEEGKKKTLLRENNSYLHDNVD